MSTEAEIEIYEKIAKIYEKRKAQGTFIPEKTRIQYSGPVFDHEEVIAVLECLLDGWLAVGRRSTEFEEKLARYLGTTKALLTNSGSSANLLAVSTLLFNEKFAEFGLKRGDEVLTPGVTFPSTINPLFQNNLTPVLLDVELGTYNVNPEDLEGALSYKTRGIMIPHLLGNPNEMDTIVDFVQEHDLILIEDVCDGLGSSYDGKKLGSFGIFGTFSFYPAHQITLGGEGGALTSSHDQLITVAKSLRDWGRAWRNGEGPKVDRSLMPDDYEKNYTFYTIGYNLKPVEMQAAMGLIQLKKLEKFNEVRRRNFKLLYEELEPYEKHFILPKTPPKGEPVWYSFPVTIRKGSSLRRKDLTEFLLRHNIEVKNLFAGNILCQPAYHNAQFRIPNPLSNAELIHKNSFMLGIYQGLDNERMKFVCTILRKFLNQHK